MLKGLGVLLIVLGCSGLGWYAVLRYTTRIRMLSELEQALQFLYGEIEYSGCDIIELLEKLTLRGGYFEGLWQGMGEALRSYDGQGFFYHWKECLQVVAGIESLKGEDMELLLSIGENIGNTDRQTQLHTLHIFQERLHGVLIQARQDYRERAKVSIVVGVTAGLFLALLLV